MGGTVDGGIWVSTYQGQSNLTSTRGSHTLRGGVDLQWAQRTSRDGAGNMGTFNYDNTYTRAADTTNVFPAQQIGLSLAAFMMGMPSSVSISDNNGFDVRNNYFGTFAQDTWRVTRNLTVNLGLRFEYENGIKESQDRALLWFDPDAAVSIAAAARAAYARSPIPEVPVSQFSVQGGSVYAGTEGYGTRSWQPEALWMPRLSFGYKLGEKNVIKGGFGVYYDTINARDWKPNQDGYDVTTTNNLSNDFGLTYLLGDPKNGILPLANPFPLRGGTANRYDPVTGNALGFDNMLGQSFTAENPDRVHSRVQRWRLGWQRELNPRTAIDIAYAGSYADRQGIALRLDYLPEQYWSSANVRDTSANDYLTQNVTNPFHISNFEALRTSDPLLYQRMAGSTFFTSTTTQRHRLLRAFPHMSAGNNGLQLQDQPLGVIKSHALEIVLTRRYANGLSANAALTVNRVTENRTVHEFDREPTLWQTNNNGRPWRLTGAAIYDLPFGPGKPFLASGGWAAALARGWTLGATYEYQPGALLNWGTLFFNGNLEDIKKDNPEIALRPDGTFDPDEDVVQHRRRVRARYRRSARSLPEADVSVPRRRRARLRFVLSERERRAHVPARRPAVVPVPPRHSEPAQPAALCQSGLEPHEYDLRAGSRGEQQRDAILHFQWPVPLLVLSEGLRPSDSPTPALARRFAGALRARGSLPPSLQLRRDLAEALRAKAGAPARSLARRCISYAVPVRAQLLRCSPSWWAARAAARSGRTSTGASSSRTTSKGARARSRACVCR